MRRAFGEFVSVMEELTGLPVTFFPVADRTIAAAAMRAGDVDIVLAGPTEYLFIKSRQDVQPVAAIERAEYYSGDSRCGHQRRAIVVIHPQTLPVSKHHEERLMVGGWCGGT